MDPKDGIERPRPEWPERPVAGQQEPNGDLDAFWSEADLDRQPGGTATHMSSPLPTGGAEPHVFQAPPEDPSSRFRARLIALSFIGGLLAAFGAGAFVYQKKTAPPEAAASSASEPDGPSSAREGGFEGAPVDAPASATSETAPSPVASSGTAVGGTAMPPGPSSPPIAPAPAPAAPSRPDAELSGVWNLATRVESSTVGAFTGMRLGYRLQLQQDGNRITGSGYKVSENGRPLRGAGRTPINVEGTADGERLSLTFTERGARRESSGTFALVRQTDRLLRGHFASDAAGSRGTVEAQRQ
jgi:hypothetical protein